MATADLVGHQLDPTADFSGPVIGMCAAVEHVIHAMAISPVVAGREGLQRQTRTFGAALDVVDLACSARGGRLPQEVRAQLLASDIDVDGVLNLCRSGAVSTRSTEFLRLIAKS